MIVRASDRVGAGEGERGMTLVEVQITVMILGMVATSFCGSLFMVTRTAGQVEQRSVAETEMRKYAEYVRSTAYEPCSDPPITSTAPASPPANAGPYWWAGTDAPAGVTGWVQNIEFGVPQTADKSALAITWLSRNVSTCNGLSAGTAAADPGLQRITLAIKVNGTLGVITTMQVIKRTPNGAP